MLNLRFPIGRVVFLLLFLLGSTTATAQTGPQAVQLLLQEAGCYPGQIDGIIGPQTLNALRTCLERKTDLPPRSALNEYLERVSEGASVTFSAPTILPSRNLLEGLSSEPTARIEPSGACAENGSCSGDISATTGRPKTVQVRGYYRRDGTYVRGHYRSRPRR
jgi:hypothetical protein